jgi:hypothetical protein
MNLRKPLILITFLWGGIFGNFFIIYHSVSLYGCLENLFVYDLLLAAIFYLTISFKRKRGNSARH